MMKTVIRVFRVNSDYSSMVGPLLLVVEGGCQFSKHTVFVSIVVLCGVAVDKTKKDPSLTQMEYGMSKTGRKKGTPISSRTDGRTRCVSTRPTTPAGTQNHHHQAKLTTPKWPP
jgi:hypothetical protein